MRRIQQMSRWVGRTAVVALLCPLITVGPMPVSPASAEGAVPQVTSAGDAAVDRAWSWVRSMLGTPTRIESTSTVVPEREYPADWTGQVRGTFIVSGVTPPPVIPAAVTLDTESAALAASPDYRGVITGRITMPPQQARWIVQVYRGPLGAPSQVPLQALAGADGSFTLDLSGADPGPGQWQIGVLDAFAGYAPVGAPWPSTGTYSGWEIRSFATTDRRYLVGVQPAAADGTFSFTSSSPGTKSFQLVATEPGQAERVLAEHAPATGLLRSFSASGSAGSPAAGDSAENARSYSYDQALAVQSALVMDDQATARVLVRGLMGLQTTTGPQVGGFVTSAPQANPAGGEPVYRTGNTAVALYALTSYLRRSSPSDPDVAAMQQAADLAAEWLLRQQLTTGPMSGLLTGGWDRSAPAVGGEPDVRLPFASTEHNLDAWHGLSRAAQVLNCQRCAAAAAAVHDGILATLWDPGRVGFTQGMRPEGRDTVDPLDVNSWGAIFLDAVGRADLAASSLHRTTAFAVSDASIAGFLMFRAQPAIPAPVPSVWLEGSFGVALAHARHGDAVGYTDVMSGLLAAQRPDGSLPHATSPDTDRELTTASSTGATTWFVIASRPAHPDSLWSAS